MGSQNSHLSQDKMGKAIENRENQINFMVSNTSIQSISSKSIPKIPNNHEEPHLNHTPMVNTTFRWTYGGAVVYVTGTFTNWRNHIAMNRVFNEFNLVLSLSAGIYQYKYIVDGEWRYSPSDMTTTDANGIVNNIIDTTKFVKQGFSNVSITNSKNILNNEFKSDLNNKESKGSACSNEIIRKIIPKANDFNSSFKNIDLGNLDKQIVSDQYFDIEAPLVPDSLRSIIFFEEKESKKKIIWRKETIKFDEKEEDPLFCFLALDNKNTLAPPQHVALNHLGSKIKTNKNLNVLILTHRFKSKYTSLKFYQQKLI